MPTDPIQEKLEFFLKRYYLNEIVELNNSYPERQSVSINFRDIDNYDSPLANILLNEPDEFLETATEALRDCVDLDKGVSISVQVIHPPRILTRKIRELRKDNVGKFVSIEGIVVKVTEVLPEVTIGFFECPFCHHQFQVVQSGRGGIEEPTQCPTEDGGCGRKVLKFSLLKDKSTFRNSQQIKIQESPEELRGGELPQTLVVDLHDDLTGKIYPGDRVNISGILRFHQRPKTKLFEFYLEANSLEKRDTGFEEIKITDEDEREILKLKDDPLIYERFIRSIAPSIYGYEEIKEALILQLFGGVSKRLPDNTLYRGDVHILLVGDPGVAKSQLLIFTTNVAPRGIYASGSSSSGVGLTAAVVKDSDFGSSKWTLEAGVLVLADKGLAVVDEFEKLGVEDRGKLHEPLAQQTVSIAKAGINVKLNARTALLAAANPKSGRFDKYTPIGEQINVSPALLSRFDFIFTLMDVPNEDTDRKIAEHILAAQKVSVKGAECEDTDLVRKFQPEISPDLLRKYITYAKRINPKLSSEAERRFEEFYVGLRMLGLDRDNAPVPVTARLMDSVIRLGEAKARTRLSKTVSNDDAECVIKIVTYCLRQVYVDPETGRLDVDWIVAGTSKTRRDRAKTIREIIKDLEKEYGDEVPITEILDLAEEKGIEREKADEVIDRLKGDGIIFSPSGGVVKFVK